MLLSFIVTLSFWFRAMKVIKHSNHLKYKNSNVDQKEKLTGFYGVSPQSKDSETAAPVPHISELLADSSSYIADSCCCFLSCMAQGLMCLLVPGNKNKEQK